MTRVICAVLLAPIALGACFAGRNPDVTPSGEGLPRLSLTFPKAVKSGTTEIAVVEVTNPGPGDMDSVLVAFSRVGAAGVTELPTPIVDSGVGGRNPAVVAIEPEPNSVSSDAVVFAFDGLEEGESITIEFTLRMPDERGPAANAIIVYDGQDVGRARGVRLETILE